MIWRILLAALLTFATALFASNAPRAQFDDCREGFCNPHVVSVGTYTGPGDLISTWDYFYALRAFSSTQRGGAIVNVCNITGGTLGTCADMHSDASTGALDSATIGGITCPNTAGTCGIKIWYDQSGNSRNATQSTVANMFMLESGSAQCGSAGVTLCAVSPGGSGGGYTFTAENETQPFTYIVTIFINSSPSITQSTIGADNASTTYNYIDYSHTANHWELDTNTGSVPSSTAATAVWTNLNGIGNGASSQFITDNVIVGASTTTGVMSATDTGHFGGDGYGDTIGGFLVEGGIIPSALNSTQYGQLCHNQFTFWGTAASC